jgi:GntR family transcriptional regulator
MVEEIIRRPEVGGSVMAVEFAPPRYVQMVNAIQQRIEAGTYPLGSLLPSENQLITEFGVSRTTVTRALNLLRQDGWIDSQQGKGTFVRGRPANTGRARQGQLQLDRCDSGPHTRLLGAGTARPPARVAEALGLPETATAVYRRQLTVEPDGTPVELVTAWFPPEVAGGTLLGSPDPIPEGVREHLRARKRLRIDHLTQRVMARLPTAEEAKALDMPRRTPVLDVVVIAYDAAGGLVQIADGILPGDRHELEDSYPMSRS